jgi:dipeptidase
MPIYAGVTAIPESFSIGDHWHLNRNSARWAFDYVDFHTQVAYSHAIEDVKKVQLIWEDGAIDKGQAIEKTALEFFKQDPKLAAEYLTDYCLSHAEKVLDAWWKLGDDLLVKYNHFRIYDPEKRTARSLQIPEWWKQAVIEYDKLEPLKK